MEIPAHPGRQAAPQQGLGAPVAQSNNNQYFTPNEALRSAQIAKANAGADKQRAEAAMLQQAGGLVPPSPEEVQFGQLKDALIRGNIATEQLDALVQAGEVSPNVASAAFQEAQRFMAEDQAMMEAQMSQGLGNFQ